MLNGSYSSGAVPRHCNARGGVRIACGPPNGDPGECNCRPAKSCTPERRLLLEAGRRRDLCVHSAKRIRPPPRVAPQWLEPCSSRVDRCEAEGPLAGSVEGRRRVVSSRRPTRNCGDRGQNPCSHTSAWISSATPRQCRAVSIDPSATSSFAARSNATQAMTFEWTKCCRAPRTSQMP